MRISAEPRQGYLRAVPMANAVLVVTSLYAVSWSLFSVLHHKPLYLKLGPALVAVAAALALRLRPVERLIVMALLIGAGIGIYGSELVGTLLSDPDRSEREAIRDVAIREGRPYDGRSKVDVIMDLRRQGIAAYPPFYPYFTFRAPLKVDGQPTLPLGTVSNTVTVCCNEGGQYLIYPTDEHGFANPRGLWKQAPIDIALVGASMATGECVPIADGIAAQLRLRFPKTVSLGAGGNGPLMELATIREYLPSLRPARILWLFAESHPNVLAKEEKVPLLRYLDSSYQQHLIERQSGIDRAVRVFLEDATQAELHPPGVSVRTKALELFTLTQVRIAVFDLGERVHPTDTSGPDRDLYRQVLTRAQQIVGEWGGKIEIIYVPDAGRYSGGFGYSPAHRRFCDESHANVLSVAGSLGIPVIDVSKSFPDLPETQRERYNQYFYPYYAHFRPEGYHVIDRTVLDALR